MDAIARRADRSPVGSLPWALLPVLLLVAATSVPVAAAAPTVTAIDPGHYHSCAATSDGGAWCWGDNGDGRLGDGTTTDRLRAVRATRVGGANLTGVTAVSAGYAHSCARTSDGAAWCWGDNGDGQLGDGTTTDRLRAVSVTRVGGADLTGVTAVGAGGSHSCARTSDGAAWCWGLNLTGGLGDGTTTNRYRAVQVTKADGAPLAGVTAVSAGDDWYSCARTSDGAAWCWGENWQGQLGDGTTTERHRAVRVTRTGGAALTAVTAVSAGAGHTCARSSDGAAWCWGDNWIGQLGDGSMTDRLRAVRVTKVGGANLPGVTAVGAGSDHSCARRGDGTAWCWGRNLDGQLGDGTTTERLRAVRVFATWAFGP